MSYYKKGNGFTIIELMVVVAVLAIAAAVAVPSFTNVIEANRLASETNRLLASINFARSEAVKIGDDVSLRAVDGGFANGWCAVTAGDCDGANVIREFEGGDMSYAAAANEVTFNSRGEQATANFSIQIEPTDCEAGEADRRRTITISISGRSSIQKGDC